MKLTVITEHLPMRLRQDVENIVHAGDNPQEALRLLCHQIHLSDDLAQLKMVALLVQASLEQK